MEGREPSGTTLGFDDLLLPAAISPVAPGLAGFAKNLAGVVPTLRVLFGKTEGPMKFRTNAWVFGPDGKRVQGKEAKPNLPSAIDS
jgi:hypothetical protein